MALTRITKGVIKPNENYDTHNIVSTGIVTSIGLDVNGNADISGSLSVGGVLTYEDVTSIDSIGIITARTGLVSPYADIDDFVSVGSNIHLGNAGVITATSFVGSGAALTGIDATAIKDSGGNVKIQAQASGAMHTGIHTFSSGAEVGSNIKLGNAGVITATTFKGDGDFVELDVDGHTNLDNVNVAGVSTFAGTLNASTVSSTAFIASGDLDVDGHTFLDNVSIAGVTTVSGILDATNTPASIRVAQDIQHKGDADTKITFPADNTISFDTAGSERLRIDSQGRLTVGATGQTSNGITEFHRDIGGGGEGCHILVKNTSTNSVNNTARLKLETSGGTAQFYAFAAASTVLTSRAGGTADLSLRADGSSKLRLYTNGNERLFINSSGHVVPGADSTYDLGLTGTRFRNVYADTLYGDGSNLTGITAGLSNIVEDTSPQLGGNLDTNGKLINFGDSSGGTVNRLQFGDGEELKLFHGSNGNSYFQSTVGGTFIRVAGTNEIALQSDGGSKNMIRAVGNGAVELYHNNTKRIETTSTGVLCLRYAFDTDNYITCNNSANTMEFVLNNTDIGEFSGSGLLIRDSMQLRVGTGNDTRFYHSGTHSYIKHAGTGNFYIDIGNDDLFAITMAESEHLANFTGNGAVELFHNGSKKFETLSYGVRVTGAITASNNINFGNNTAKFMSGSANQLQMYYDGSNAYINNTVASQLKFATNNTVRCQLQSDGHWAPVANNTYDLGTSSMRWRNLYVDDLQLSNEGSKNDVDGTWGDWTLQEGEDKVFMINNRTGKRYSLKMEEE